MRSRNIKPGFFCNEDLARCKYGARLLFIGLWCAADREGRLQDRPQKLRVLLFPYDGSNVSDVQSAESECDIEGWLQQLAENKFITRYVKNGCKYIQVNTFRKHQHCHVKEQASTIPAPDMPGSCPSESLLLNTEYLLLKDERGKPVPGVSLSKPKRKRAKQNEREYTEDFLRFWNAYPPIRRGGKPVAFEAWTKAIKRCPPESILDAVEAFAGSPLAKSKFCPGPAPWLNQDRWEDDRACWQIGDGEQQVTTTCQPLDESEYHLYQPGQGGSGA